MCVESGESLQKGWLKFWSQPACSLVVWLWKNHLALLSLINYNFCSALLMRWLEGSVGCRCAWKIVECNARARVYNYSLCSLLLGDRDLDDYYCRVLTIHRLPPFLPLSQGSKHSIPGSSSTIQRWKTWGQLDRTDFLWEGILCEGKGEWDLRRNYWRFLCMWQDLSHKWLTTSGETRLHLGKNKPGLKKGSGDTGHWLWHFIDFSATPSNLLCEVR